VGTIKKFFIKAFILFILLGLFLLSVTLVPMPENAYNLAIIDKHRILAHTKSPKIVLAGGSNLAFGIDSATIQNSFNVPVVNTGVQVMFGLGRILDDISPFLQTGDILLIIPEYQHFTSLWNGDSIAYQLIFDCRQFQLLLSPYYSLPSGLSRYFSDHPTLLSVIISLFERNNTPEDHHPEMYTRDGFNEYGDYVKHLGFANKSFDDHSMQDIYDKSYLERFFKMVDDFYYRGITVALSYPSFEEQSFRNSVTVIQELDTVFRKKENLLVISTPESYCYPVHYFYDSPYHLNVEGRTTRTEQLIRDLQASSLSF
jgi:hypothetical protein